jgi:hypothetical protein
MNVSNSRLWLKYKISADAADANIRHINEAIVAKRNFFITPLL